MSNSPIAKLGVSPLVIAFDVPSCPQYKIFPAVSASRIAK
jgi:hypothetical protein